MTSGVMIAEMTDCRGASDLPGLEHLKHWHNPGLLTKPISLINPHLEHVWNGDNAIMGFVLDFNHCGKMDDRASLHERNGFFGGDVAGVGRGIMNKLSF